jgi:SAM-dependent methyltransferase
MLLRAALAISEVGERLHVDALVYNPLLFEWYRRRAKRDAPGVIATFEELFPDARSYVDVGAGSGTFAARAQALGHRVVACEYSKVGRLFAGRAGVDCRPFDLTADPPARVDGPFDLAYCFEVAEHVEPRLGDRLVQFVAGQAPLVVFTAARPGQEGVGHVNEQPASYWIERFAQAGMSHRQELSSAVADAFRRHGVRSPWLVDNVLIFERT